MSAHHLTLTGSVSAGSGQATRRRRSARHLMVLPLIWLVRAYQLVVSPMRPPCCRFYPSCSAYALTALERFGLLRGGWLALRRLRHCHPWNPGGVDHVPPAEPPDHQHHH